MPIYLQIEAKLRMIRLLWKVDACNPQIRTLNQEVIRLYGQLATEYKYKTDVDCWS